MSENVPFIYWHSQYPWRSDILTPEVQDVLGGDLLALNWPSGIGL